MAIFIVISIATVLQSTALLVWSPLPGEDPSGTPPLRPPPHNNSIQIHPDIPIDFPQYLSGHTSLRRVNLTRRCPRLLASLFFN
jgi:hypothetical protein